MIMVSSFQILLPDFYSALKAVRLFVELIDKLFECKII